MNHTTVGYLEITKPEEFRDLHLLPRKEVIFLEIIDCVRDWAQTHLYRLHLQS